MNDETIKRTGLDYREHVHYHYYDSYQDFMDKNHHPVLHCLTRYGDKIYTEITVKNKVEDIYLLFGSETSGLTPEIMKQHQQHLYRIPMSILARSLNVSNTVALVMYEILRQQQFSGLATKEVLKGEHFLKDKLNQ